MQWQKKLNKKERAHLKYATNGITTKTAFAEARKTQLEHARATGYDREPCFECWEIARKLGIEK